jgi:hypothetical protein
VGEGGDNCDEGHCPIDMLVIYASCPF